MEFTFVDSRGDGPYHEDELPVETYLVSRDVATSTRSRTLDGPVDMYVVSRDVATNTRLMTLNGPSHWSHTCGC